MRTSFGPPPPTALAALSICLLLFAGACGDSSPAADPASTTTEPSPPPDPSPPTAPDRGDLPACVLAPGPVALEGVVVRVTGGFAGIDESTLVPADCASEPIPLVDVDWRALTVVESSTDCEDCADAMSGATSEPVEVEGELVPADEIDLAPGETLAPGDLVLTVKRATTIS